MAVTPEEVVNLIGIDISNLPSPWTNTKINNLINKIFSLIENEFKTKFNSEGTFEEYFYSENISLNRIIYLKYRKPTNIKVYYKFNNEWVELDSEDYRTNDKMITIKYPLSDTEIKVTGKYGNEIPDIVIEELVRVLSAIYILTSISGSNITEKSIEGFTLGDFTKQVRPIKPDTTPYFQVLEKRRDYLLDILGLNRDKKISFKII